MNIVKSWINKKEKPGTPLWKALFLHGNLPWRYKAPFIHAYNSLPHRKYQTRLIDAYMKRPVNRLRLRFLKLPEYEKEDITVILPVRDRCGQRIKHTCESIRTQDYPQDLIQTVLIDHGSRKDCIPEFRALCAQYDIDYIRVDGRPVWSRSYCSNIGIKRAETKYLLTSDVDIIFEKNYIREAVRELKRNPFRIIVCRCLDLPENVQCENRSFEELRDEATPRLEGACYGINAGLTFLYQKIRGYDEFYRLWGAADDDLIKRFALLGLKIKDITGVSSYIHQWHPRHEDVQTEGYEEQFETNTKHLVTTHSIIRNRDGWGEIE